MKKFVFLFLITLLISSFSTNIGIRTEFMKQHELPDTTELRKMRVSSSLTDSVTLQGRMFWNGIDKLNKFYENPV